MFRISSRHFCFSLFGKASVWFLFLSCTFAIYYIMKGDVPFNIVSTSRTTEVKKTKVTVTPLRVTEAKVTLTLVTAIALQVTVPPKSNHSEAYRKYAVTDFAEHVPVTATHMAEGTVPTNRSRLLPIHWQTTPPLETNKLVSTEEIVKYYKDLQTLATSLNSSMSELKVIKLLSMGNIFPPDIQQSLETFDSETLLSENDNILESKLDVTIDRLHLLSERHVQHDTPRLKTCDKCFVVDFKFSIVPKATEVCGHQNLQMLVLVTSVPMATKERMTIRETWGAWAKEEQSESKFVFLFGGGWDKNETHILLEENKHYGDILQVDLKSHYYNTTQTILMGYKWVLENCKKNIFIMRARDDTFVHLPNINRLLDTYGYHSSFLDYQIGYCNAGVKPPRSPWSFQYIVYNEYPYQYFPPYSIGRNYITSYNLTEKIIKASPYIPYFPIDDVYFGFVLQSIGSGCHLVQGFVPEQGTKLDDFKTLFYFSSALENPQRMKEIYNFFKK